MILFDSHCHLDDRSFRDDLGTVIAAARAAGVARMMTIGVTLRTSRTAVELAKTRPGVYASVGVHPHDAQECSGEALDELVRLSRNPEVRAWGRPALISTACTRPATRRKNGSCASSNRHPSARFQ
jgi:TatD DNase family protein